MELNYIDDYPEYCPRKALQAKVVGTSEVLGQSAHSPVFAVQCDSDCTGPREYESTSTIRRIGHKILPGLVEATVLRSVCPRDIATAE